MKRRPPLSVLIVGFLVVLGIGYRFMTRPSDLLIPIIVFGVIFLLWKYPPQTWKGRGPWSGSSPKRPGKSSPTAQSKAAKRAKFRVIQGNKGRHDDDEDTPKYH